MCVQLRLRIGLLLVAAIIPAAAAMADDLLPPPWRGQPLTTLAEWEFLSPANPTPPDGTIVPVVGNGGGGGPLASIGGPILWDPFDGDGAWIGNAPAPGGPPGQISLDIPNWIDTMPLKWVQIQMTVQRYFDTTDPLNPVLVTPYVDSISAFDPSGPTSSMLIQVLPELPVNPTDGTFLRTEWWKIVPNPDNERIVINVPVDTLVDEIVVDTISFVPEPSSIVMLGIAIAGLAFRRRPHR